MMESVGEAERSAPFTDGKTEAIARIISEHTTQPIQNLLVVGCGSGIEAAILANELRADVTGIDLNSTFDPRAMKQVSLLRGDATQLGFPDESFDFVFSYHALEHIPDYRSALSEMKRVLRRGGGFCIGTPNSMRVVGYLGSKDATTREKVVWNLADWKAQLNGKFRNEFGAHAGFTSQELRAELEQVFSHVEEFTLSYYSQVYSRHMKLVRILNASGLGRFLFPCIYFVGKK